MERSELTELLKMYYQVRQLIKVDFIHVKDFIPVNVKDTIETEYKRLCDIEADFQNYAEQTRRLNWLRDQMDCNGEGAYFNYDAFKNKTDDVCYIPANAETLDDVFTYGNLRGEVVNWLKQDNTINWLKDQGVDFEYKKGFSKGKTNPVNLMTESVVIWYPVIHPYVDQYLDILFSGLTWEFPATYLNELLND